MQFKGANLILTLAITQLFLAGLMFSSVLPYQSVMGIEVFGLENTSYSLLVLTASICSVALSILIGIVADHTGNWRQLLLLTLLITLVGQLLIFLFPAPLTFVLGNLLVIPSIWIYLVSVVICLICFAITFLFWPKSRREHSTEPGLSFFGSFREILDSSVLVRLGVMGMILGAQRLY